LEKFQLSNLAAGNFFAFAQFRHRRGIIAPAFVGVYSSHFRYG